MVCIFSGKSGTPNCGSYPVQSVYAVSLKGEDSKELKVLKGCRENLKNALTFDIGWIAHQMNIVGLLSESDYELLGNTKTNMSDRQKTETMLSSLQKKIDLKSENLYTFRDVLRQKPWMYKEALEMLEGMCIINSSWLNTMLIICVPHSIISLASVCFQILVFIRGKCRRLMHLRPCCVRI